MLAAASPVCVVSTSDVVSMLVWCRWSRLMLLMCLVFRVRLSRMWIGFRRCGREYGVCDFHVGVDGSAEGVAVSHRSVVNQVSWLAERYAVSGSDVCCSRLR